MIYETTWQKRLQKVVMWLAVVLVVGIVYGAFVEKTGLAIPCMFRQITGVLCPGCGMTRMCIALLQLDFVKAYERNQVLFVQLPVLGIVFIKYLVDFIKTGRWQMGRMQQYILYVCIVALIVFGVLRNIVLL